MNDPDGNRLEFASANDRKPHGRVCDEWGVTTNGDGPTSRHQKSDAPIRVMSAEHAAVPVTDRKRAITFYRDVVGLEIIPSMVETDGLEGFRRGRNLKKIGLKSQDTSELFFDNVKVPQTHLLGTEEGQGFYQLMKQLPWERLYIGITALGSMDCALEETTRYVQERKAFGQRVMDFQNTRFKLAEIKTKIEVTRSFINDAITRLETGTLDAATASMAKWWGSQVQCDIIDECLQLHGGYGYMMEYPIARLYTDARVQKIYGGTNEIMKELIARSMDI